MVDVRDGREAREEHRRQRDKKCLERGSAQLAGQGCSVGFHFERAWESQWVGMERAAV